MNIYIFKCINKDQICNLQGKAWILNENLDNAAGSEQSFSTAGRTDKADDFVEKKVKFSSKSNPGERRSQRRKFTSASYHEFSQFSGL